MARIALRNRAGEVRAYALVDAADLSLVQHLCWHLDSAGYVRHSQHGPTRRAVFMHRLLMGEPPCKVDHENGNTLDNRRSNLRLATDQQNQQHRTKLDRRSTTGRRGVSYNKAAGRFEARVQIEGVQRHLGFYDTVEEAATIATAVREEHYGEFAGTAP